MTASKKRVTVFCGSAPGHDPIYLQNAREMGRTLAERGVGLVYGGAGVGTMGALADACLAAGGDVVGVIPRALVDKEIAHAGLPELFVVSSMHERKAKMAELGSAFIAMPGGAGTMEEIFEVWTWRQIGLHDKPCVLENLAGFYDPLIAQVDLMAARGLMPPRVRAMLAVATNVDDALAAAGV